MAVSCHCRPFLQVWTPLAPSFLAPKYIIPHPLSLLLGANYAILLDLYAVAAGLALHCLQRFLRCDDSEALDEVVLVRDLTVGGNHGSHGLEDDRLRGAIIKGNDCRLLQVKSQRPWQDCKRLETVSWSVVVIRCMRSVLV